MLGAGLQDPKALAVPGTKANQPFRFYLKNGTQRQIIFLDDPRTAPPVLEHNFRLMRRGKLSWGNFETCVSRIPGMTCPACRYAEQYGNYGASATYFMTVIDMTPYKNPKTGAVKKYTKMLFAAKQSTMEKLTRRSLEQTDKGRVEGLRGCIFNAARSSEPKSPAVGDDFTFVQVVDLTKLPPEDRVPFNYAELLAPDITRLHNVVKQLREGFTGSEVATGNPVDDLFGGGAGASSTESTGVGILSEMDDGGLAGVEVDYSSIEVPM
jgi:hypothetical protein